jgi:hypothetical protein
MATFVVLSLGLGTGKIRFGRRFSGKQSSAIIKRGGIQDRKDQVQVTITSGSSSFLQEKKKKMNAPLPGTVCIKDERPGPFNLLLLFSKRGLSSADPKVGGSVRRTSGTAIPLPPESH